MKGVQTVGELISILQQYDANQSVEIVYETYAHRLIKSVLEESQHDGSKRIVLITENL